MPQILHATIVQSLDKISNIGLGIGVRIRLITILAFVVAPLAARADGIVSTDFVFQLDNSVFKTPDYAFKKLLVAPPTIDLPDQIIQDQAPVHVTGIQAELKYEFETSTLYPVLGAETTIATKTLTGKIKIGKIDVDSDIVISDGGATAIGHLKATCNNVVVNLTPGKARAMGSIAILLDAGGQPLIKIPWFQVDWSEDAWQVGDITCTGARNFAVRAKRSLTEYFKKSAAFAPQFRSFIEETAAQQQTKIRESLVNPIDLKMGLAGIKMRARPQKIEMISGDRFQLRGQLDIAFESSAFNETKVLTRTAGLTTQKIFSLALPDGVLSALNEMAYKSGYYATQKLGSAMAAFQTFRESGLAVSFVWPELGRYPKEMDFIFDFKGDSQPNLVSLTSDGAGGLLGKMLATLRVNVSAQKFSLPIKYGEMGTFRTPIQADYKLSVLPKENGSTLQIGFVNLASDLKYVWSPNYKPEADSVNVETLSNEIRDSLMKEPLQFEVNSFDLTPTLRLRASGLRKSGGWLFLDFI